MIKHAPLSDADFITLRAGKTKLISANLSAVYGMTNGGEYSVRFKSYLQGAKTKKGRMLTTTNGRMALLQSPELRASISPLTGHPNAKLNTSPVDAAQGSHAGLEGLFDQAHSQQ